MILFYWTLLSCICIVLQVNSLDTSNSSANEVSLILFPRKMCLNGICAPERKTPTEQSADLFKVDQFQLTVLNASIHLSSSKDTIVPNYYVRIKSFFNTTLAEFSQTAPDARNTSEPVWNHTFSPINGPFNDEDRIFVVIEAVDNKTFNEGAFGTCRAFYSPKINHKFSSKMRNLTSIVGGNVFEVEAKERVYNDLPQGFINVQYRFVFSQK